jgi:hypothetical protein
MLIPISSNKSSCFYHLYGLFIHERRLIPSFAQFGQFRNVSGRYGFFTIDDFIFLLVTNVFSAFPRGERSGLSLDLISLSTNGINLDVFRGGKLVSQLELQALGGNFSLFHRGELL